MARKQSSRKAASKPAPSRNTRGRSNASSRKAAKKSASRKPAAKKSARSPAPRHKPTPGLDGWITHTEIASADPQATKAWCATVLGWTFKPSVPSPAGEYHLFAYSDKGGGGIRSTHGGESPGTMPFVHVADARAAFEKAIGEGAEPVAQPERVMEGVTIAIVRAPGGVSIGFSGP
jgi:predicted enzyme related to lactoylglutathione lyase